MNLIFWFSCGLTCESLLSSHDSAEEKKLPASVYKVFIDWWEVERSERAWLCKFAGGYCDSPPLKGQTGELCWEVNKTYTLLRELQNAPIEKSVPASLSTLSMAQVGMSKIPTLHEHLGIFPRMNNRIEGDKKRRWS